MTNISHPAADDDLVSAAQQSDTEARMRRALGLAVGGKVASRDGQSVVVEHRGGRNPRPAVNRVALAEDALASERQARERAERLLHDTKAALVESETKYRHAELALDDMRQALEAERNARELAEQGLKKAQTADQILQKPATHAAAPVVSDAYADIVKRPRGRPKRIVAQLAPEPELELADPQPVEWWRPGWRQRPK